MKIQAIQWFASGCRLKPGLRTKCWNPLWKSLGRLLLWSFWLAAALNSRAAVIKEDFATDPAQRGWRRFGEPSLFHWNPSGQNLAVTWDSSQTNSFFYLPLGTVLATNDDFSFSFELRLSDLRLGNTPGKTNTFEIAVGLINYSSATNAHAFRGAGVNSTYGVKNIVEFDYFPDAGYGDTIASTIISTNNRFATMFNAATLDVGATYAITMTYTGSNQVLRTAATRNGVPLPALFDVHPTNDFRVDSFAVMSYSDAIQAPPAIYYGSILAHGVVDNVQLTVPPPPMSPLRLRLTNSVWQTEFSSLTNWVYTLENRRDLSLWGAISSASGNGGTLALRDTNAPSANSLYRVRAERP